MVPDAELSDATMLLARKLAHGPRLALAAMKQNLNAAESGTLAQLLDLEARRQIETGLTEDHREAARAFVEKRAAALHRALTAARMGKKIAIVGAGAVGGYTGAHMVQAGEDVTFIDPWPDNVEHLRAHGLRVTHAKDVPEFTVPVRALHVTDAQITGEGTARRHRLHLHEVLRHGMGGDADPAISRARRLSSCRCRTA